MALAIAVCQASAQKHGRAPSFSIDDKFPGGNVVIDSINGNDIYVHQDLHERNTLALSLANKKTLVIGIIVPEILNSFYPSVIRGAEDHLNSEKYKAIICHSNENYEKEVENVKLLLSQQVDGIILSHTKETRNFDHLKLI